MAANVETMMYVREKPWHGLGTEVSDAPSSEDALRFAGLDWTVRQENVFNARGGVIKGFKANVRDSDDSVLGVVGDRYKVVQNTDAFKFTDDLSTPYQALQDAIHRYNQGKAESEQLPLIPFHGLRHTSATLLISSNQDIATVSRRLGHAHTSVTLDIYTHALPKSDRNASEALEGILENPRN